MVKKFIPLILLVFLLLLGGVLLSISTLNTGDFIYTNTETRNSQIILEQNPIEYTSPTFNDIKTSTLYTEALAPFTPSSSDPIRATSEDVSKGLTYYCEARDGYLVDFSSVNVQSIDLVYIHQNQWVTDSNGNNWDKADSITCTDGTFKTSGDITTSNFITLGEDVSAIVLDYDKTLNSGSITPFLIYGGEEFVFSNDMISKSLSEGDQFKLKFVYSGSSSQSPTIDSEIIVSKGSPSSSASTSTSSTSGSSLDVITTLKAGSVVSSVSGSSVPISQYFSNLLFNFIASIESLFS